MATTVTGATPASSLLDFELHYWVNWRILTLEMLLNIANVTAVDWSLALNVFYLLYRGPSLSSYKLSLGKHQSVSGQSGRKMINSR